MGQSRQRCVAGIFEDVGIPALAQLSHIVQEEIQHALVTSQLIVLDLTLIHVDIVVTGGAKHLTGTVHDAGKVPHCFKILGLPRGLIGLTKQPQ